MGRKAAYGARIALVIALVPLLSGCFLQFSLDKLQHTEPQGTPFHKALTAFYQQYAEAEARQYDWADAGYFARKGLITARGEDVMPEDPKDWDISETQIENLNKARGWLLEAVTEQAKREDPEVAARAYYFYDCWVEQLEEDWQTEHISSCRDTFFEVLDYLTADKQPVKENEVDVPEVPDSAPSPDDITIAPEDFEEVVAEDINPDAIVVEEFEEVVQEEGAAAAKEPESSSSYVIFFDFDSAALNQDAYAVVGGVVGQLQAEQSYEVVVHGHADRSGNAAYNQKLSKRRANAVGKALVEKGLDSKHIVIYAHGETKPHITTEDGVRLQANRRVEIYLH